MTTDHIVRGSRVLAAGLVLASIIASYTYYSVKTMGNTLVVTGSAMATTTADVGKLTVSVSRAAYEATVASTQDRVSVDTKTVSDYFKKNGIEADDVRMSPVYVDREYSSDQNAPQKYNVRQEITVQSNDPRAIEQLSKNVSSLASRGIYLSVQPPQYFVSNLPELRVALIGKAVTDAKARATEIAKSTGQKVGRLQSASSGVVQVMSPNSIDVADYGSYDTSTIDKQVMVTARATFVLD